MQDLNKISVEEQFMIRFTDSVISIGGFLPKFNDVHLSLSLRSPRINFHATREINNPGDKPKNEVFEVDISACDELINDIGIYLLRQSLTELDISQIKGTISPRFIAHSSMQESEFYLSVEKDLQRLASNFLKRVGKKELKIKSNAVDELENLTGDELAFIKLYNHSIEISEVKTSGILSGIIVTESNIYTVIHSSGKWFITNNQITIENFLDGFGDEKFKRQLFYLSKKAIVIVRYANSYTEVKHLNKPLRLVKLDNKWQLVKKH
ncbi:MAG: hypothetical protein SGI96_21745 [Bacteroidota bacterium]|nr:hypothetical protein [Bacteroidota bacterium]